jgi:uncharacterized protein (TIGR00369 family)
MTMHLDRDSVLAGLREHIGKPLPMNLSPVGRWLDGILEELHEDGATVSYAVREEMTNPAGILHGGMAATMMDELTGATVMVITGRFYASINLSMDYLAPARLGERVYARSRVVREGKRLVHVEGTLRLASPTGDLVAKSSSNLIVVGE